MARPIIISMATTRDSAKILKRDVKPSVTVEKIITKIKRNIIIQSKRTKKGVISKSGDITRQRMIMRKKAFTT